jgi:DNA polymerase-3 subunit gamma/tau
MLPGLGDADRTPGRTQSLYRKYRPTTFEDDELVGQEHIARTLRNAIARGRVAHAYLFCGPRGTGKTSTARLLAKAVNCLHEDPAQRPCNTCASCIAINNGSATDIVEIDAASNRGIDDMRDLRERVNYAPVQLKTKFYIIDEAHQVTKDAFNAFLKTLEEPPPNTTFILATTDPDKLPETIASRCQRFDFRRIPRDGMVAHMRRVADREGIAIDDEVLEIVARRATGSLRDGLSLIDMLATAAGEQTEGRIDTELTRRMLGLTDDGWEYELIRALADRDVTAGLAVISNVVDAGHDMRSFGKRLLELLRVLMLVRAGADPVESNETIRELAPRFELPQLLAINRQFSDVDFKIRSGSFPQLPLELAFIGSLIDQPPGSAQAAAPVSAPAAVPRQAMPERRPAEFQRRPPAEPQAARSAPASSPYEPHAVRPAPSGSPYESEDQPRRQPAPQTQAPPPAPPSPPRASNGSSDDSNLFQRISAGWERIRTEVKTVDRKVEALLASADPGSVSGATLYVIAAYPFHVGKLNDAKVRGIVEDAVERIVGERLNAAFVLRDELPGASTGSPAPASPTPPSSWDRQPAPPPVSTSNGVYEDAPPFDDDIVPPDDDAFDRTVKASLNAEVVTDPDEIARIP